MPDLRLVLLKVSLIFLQPRLLVLPFRLCPLRISSLLFTLPPESVELLLEIFGDAVGLKLVYRQLCPESLGHGFG
jgi:hypothetical protein